MVKETKALSRRGRKYRKGFVYRRGKQRIFIGVIKGEVLYMGEGKG